MSGAIDIPVVSKFDPTGIKQAQSALGGFGKAVAGIGAVIAGAFAVRAVVNFAGETIRMAEEAMQAEAVLRQVAKTTGVFGDEVDAVTKRLIDYSNAQELRLGVDAEIIQQVQAQLLTFKAVGASADEAGGAFDRATQAAFDIAMVMKKDASSGAVMLGKALTNPVSQLTSLRKAGVDFTDQQKDQIRILVESNRLLDAQALILSEVESQVGGAAEAGALWSEKFRLAVDRIKETIGIALLPAFESFTQYFVGTVAPVLVSFFETQMPILIERFKSAWEGIRPALEIVGEALRNALDIPDDVTLLEALLDKIANLPENTAFQNFVQSLVDLTPALLELLPPLAELVQELLPLAMLIIPFITDFIKGLIPVFGQDGLAGAIQIANEQLSLFLDFSAYIEELGKQFGAVIEALATPWVALTVAINNAYNALLRFFNLSGTSRPSVNLDRRVGTRADGGRVTGGSPYLVGEVGPELFVPGRGGMIIPNDRLGAGGSNITINVQAGMGANGAMIGQEIVNAIARYERSSGPVFARV